MKGYEAQSYGEGFADVYDDWYQGVSNVDDTIAFSVVEGPDGLAIDAATGEVAFAPTIDAPPEATVTILASDGRGGDTEQTWTLAIEGGMGGGDESSGGDD